jgi:flagellar biogenesis protein FliO
MAAKKTRSLEAAERLALTPQHSIHLIRVHGREVVIATHPQGCTVIETGASAHEVHA